MRDYHDEMPDEAANGFAVYVAGGGRSLLKTAQLLGKPRGTVQSWAHRYRWKELADDDDTDVRRGAVESAAVIAAAQLGDTVRVAMTIRDDPKASGMARMRAVEFLAGIAGVRAGTMEAPASKSDAITGEQLAVADLVALVNAGNLAALIAIAQGRAPTAALPASSGLVDDYPDAGE